MYVKAYGGGGLRRHTENKFFVSVVEPLRSGYPPLDLSVLYCYCPFAFDDKLVLFCLVIKGD